MSELNKEDTIKQIMMILPDVDEHEIRAFVTKVVIPCHKEVMEEYNKEPLVFGPKPKHLVDADNRRAEALGCKPFNFHELFKGSEKSQAYIEEMERLEKEEGEKK
jgi:hypothetical protein